jgi:hypothetical protein
MKQYKVKYKCWLGCKELIREKILIANSPEDAVKKMDMYPELIIKITRI